MANPSPILLATLQRYAGAYLPIFLPYRTAQSDGKVHQAALSRQGGQENTCQYHSGHITSEGDQKGLRDVLGAVTSPPPNEVGVTEVWSSPMEGEVNETLGSL